MTAVVASTRHHGPPLILKAAASTLLLLATAVSFAPTEATRSMLAKANHSAATKGGSFLGTASLACADVQGVPVDNGG